MKKRLISIIAMLFLVSIVTAACGSQPDQKATELPAPSATAVLPTETSVPTSLPTVEPTATNTPAPDPIPCTIAFETNRDKNWEIYRMDPDGNNLQNLTNANSDDTDAAWSPDGKWIAFVSNRKVDEGDGLHLFVMDLNGQQVRQLTHQNGGRSPAWSPDGKQIAYQMDGEIYTINADGSGETVNLTQSKAEDRKPVWSQDGKTIAWVSDKQVMVMQIDGSGKKSITRDGDVGDVRWSVDGNLVFFDPKNSIGCGNCVVNLDGIVVAQFDKGNLQQWLPFWTLDGKKVTLMGDKEIQLVGDVYPGYFLNLTNNPAEDMNPSAPANCGPVSVNPPQVKPEVVEPTKQSDGELTIGYETGDRNAVTNLDLLLQACGELKVTCVEGKTIRELADQGADAIISFSNRWHVEGSAPDIHDAIQRGIPVFVLNAESNQEGAYNLSIGSQAARSDLDWMIDQMGGKGKLVYYNFGQDPAIEAVFAEELAKFPGVKGVGIKVNQGDGSVTKDGITKMVKADPEIRAIWANDQNQDVFWGVEAAGEENPPLVLCNPKEDLWRGWQEKAAQNPNLKCRSVVSPIGTPYEAVYVAYGVLRGEKINPEALGGIYGNSFIYDYPVVTNDNLGEWLGKVGILEKGQWDSFWMKPMTPEEIMTRWFVK